jgi:hypothetical protein
MSASCTHPCDTEDEHLFCQRCGKVRDRDSLRTVRIAGFTGGQTLNPKLEKFWQTGDPEGL